MGQQQRAESLARVAVENVGGIDETTVELASGVTVLAGENATNRTSFLQSLRAVLGSDDASLKGDADAGRVRMTLEGETYERELHRRGETVTFDGDPYLDDPTLADLFAVLLEDNAARRAVARGEDLRELIMRPIDVAAIRSEIADLEEEKAAIDDELATIEGRKGELTDLERRKTELEGEIERRREELSDLEDEIAAADVDVAESAAEKDRLEERLEELSDARNELERVRRDADAVEEAIESLREERADLEAEREQLPESPDCEGIDEDIAGLRREKDALQAEVRELQQAIEFNEEMLDGAADSALSTLDDDDPTAELLADERVCWTCGSTVDADAIESTLASLRELRQAKLDEVDDVEGRIESLRERQREIERARERREEIEDRIDAVTAELEEREATLETLRAERSRLTEEVADLEAAVEDAEVPERGDLLDRHREANELEFKLEEREERLAEIEAEIADIEDDIAREADLERRREAVEADLADRRTRIERVQGEAVDAFNDHMAAILDVLAYDNIERIWIERREVEGAAAGARGPSAGAKGAAEGQAVFDLHVVRSTAGGTVYEDTVDHLSESEREVTGLVFALAGYLVHDVHETVPFVLLDSLEAIDSARIAALVEYFADYAEFLVVALLPEDAQAIDVAHDRVTDI